MIIPSSLRCSQQLNNFTKYKSLLTGQVQQKKIQKILEQYEYLKYMGEHVPQDISPVQMSDLLQIDNDRNRQKYLRYLFLNEIRKQKDLRKREQRRMMNEEYLMNRAERTFGIFDADGQHLSYGLWGNSLVGRFSSRNLSHVRTERRLRFASMFGQKLIIDLDYDHLMTLSECRIQVRHIVQLVVNNLRHYEEPYDIIFTNCDYEKPTMKTLKEKYFHSNPFKMMPPERHFRSESYLDLFSDEQDRQRLVYLTPDANETMREYNAEDIYIIGAFLDKSSLDKPMSFIKSSREGIRQYRLPLDEYVQWGPGSSKHLCIMHVVDILNRRKLGMDWPEALHQSIPKRKIKQPVDQAAKQQTEQIAFLKRKLSIFRVNNERAQSIN